MASFESFIINCSELQLFGAIYKLGGNLFYIQHDLADGRIKSTPAIETGIAHAQSQIEQAVDQTIRFGVMTPRTENGATREYWEWYRAVKPRFKALEKLWGIRNNDNAKMAQATR